MGIFNKLFTRPELDNRQFLQSPAGCLTLSGDTDFVGVLRSKGIEIDATSGATNVDGDVLRLENGKIVLSPGTTAFDSDRATTRSGIPVVNVGGDIVTDFLEDYFFPPVPPGATITGGGTRQFGDNANVELAWTAIRETYPIVSIVVNGSSMPVVDGESRSGSVAGIITPINVNKTFDITVTDSFGLQGNASTSVTFNHKRFYFAEGSDLIAESDPSTISTIVKLYEGTNSELATSQVKSKFNLALSNAFFYYVYPASFGVATFIINGLASNDFTSKGFLFTNSNGYGETYRLYRLNNIQNTTLQIEVQ